jgi:hypothetical protein
MLLHLAYHLIKWDHPWSYSPRQVETLFSIGSHEYLRNNLYVGPCNQSKNGPSHQIFITIFIPTTSTFPCPTIQFAHVSSVDKCKTERNEKVR